MQAKEDGNIILTDDPAPPPNGVLRLAILASFFTLFTYFVWISLHWPLLLDSPVMHYVVFLMDHGFRPYADITDNNLPGAYLTELWAMRTFGYGDLSWRLYEYCLLGVLTWCMCRMARRFDWLGGLLAASLFIALHGMEGPGQAVEREEVCASLIMLCYALTFNSVEKSSFLPVFLGCVAGGVASSIKPTFLPVVLSVVILAATELRKRKGPFIKFLTAGLAGLVTVAVLIYSFLVKWGVTKQFFEVQHSVTMVYRGQPNWSQIAMRILPHDIMPIVPFGLYLLLFENGEIRWNWERTAIATGALLGLVSYFAQGKGSAYHRYVYITFLLLLICTEALLAIKQHGRRRLCGIAIILISIVFTIPNYMRSFKRFANESALTNTLEADLALVAKQGGLQHQVMCLDMTDGCLSALYHMRVVEWAGFTGDMLLFTTQQTDPSRYYRQLFWQKLTSRPPRFLVISNQFYWGASSFNKVRNWPQFEAFLNSHYVKAVERDFPHEGLRSDYPPLSRDDIPAYKVYVLREK